MLSRIPDSFFMHLGVTLFGPGISNGNKTQTDTFSYLTTGPDDKFALVTALNSAF
jgi:hypothetical protein